MSKITPNTSSKIDQSFEPMQAMNDPISKVLQLLTKVKQRQSGQWSACCPAHNDNGPSLSIRETPEGAVLLHCFGGCPTTAVISAIGIDMNDLFPPKQLTGREPKRKPRLLSASQALELLADEALILLIVGRDLAKGIVTVMDLERAALAVRRICVIRNEISGGLHAA